MSVRKRPTADGHSLGAGSSARDPRHLASAAWLGVEEKVENLAMPTLGYTTEPSDQWLESVRTYARTMDGMGMFTGTLHGMDDEELDRAVFDFSYLEEAKQNAQQRVRR
ncbi:MAG: hypothetical protein Kow0092_29480 [Deferrisomatales bacterium]